jgi:hypothetical protein
MTGLRTRRSLLSSYLVVAVAAATFSVALSSPGAVVIFDGFGDADLNNNGTALEFADVDVNHNEDIGMYTPGRASNSSGGMNAELTSALDSNDKGLRWLFHSGFTNNNTGDPKAYISIVDDSQGAMLETKPAASGGLGIAAIDDGYAMSWNSKGRGSAAVAFFDQALALGPEAGDQVKVSFDYRVWRDSPNANPVEAPADGQLRFGLFQDTDNQLGMTNPIAGQDFDDNGDGSVETHSAVWGQEGGWFEGQRAVIPGAGNDVGSPGDHGWYGQIIISDDSDPVFMHQVPNGGDWRIREELNEAEGGGNDRRILNGASDTVAVPQEANPGSGDYGLLNLDPTKVYNISLTLERHTQMTTADTILATLTVKDRASGQEYSLSDYEPLMNMGNPDGIESEDWDYFAISNTSTVDDFDFILDNFMIEVVGSNEPGDLTGDYNGDGAVDAADYVVWRKNNINGQQGYDDWRANFGRTSGPGSGSLAANVPEPSGMSLVTIGGVLFVRRVRRLSAKN